MKECMIVPVSGFDGENTYSAHFRPSCGCWLDTIIVARMDRKGMRWMISIPLWLECLGYIGLVIIIIRLCFYFSDQFRNWLE